LETTSLIIRELAACGASLIEVGFPYSDPIADGSVIQASYTRALECGIKVADIFKGIADCRLQIADRQSKICNLQSEIGNPVLVGMVSYSLVHHHGLEAFVMHAQDAGFSGAIVPDLPVEESEPLARIAKDRDF